jgi:hypothetical protein
MKLFLVLSLYGHHGFVIELNTLLILLCFALLSFA